MFIQVRLLKGYAQPLLYQVPLEMQGNLAVGSLVRVPLQKQVQSALVLQTFSVKPVVPFEIRSIMGIETVPHDPHYLTFIRQLAYHYQTDELHYLRRMRQFIAQKPISASRSIIEIDLEIQSKPDVVMLTDEQQHIVNALIAQLYDK